jgi:hypothetical protein
MTVGRCTHRVAIANDRLLDIERDHAFHRIRYYGFLGARYRRDKLAHYRRLLFGGNHLWPDLGRDK